MVINYFMDEDLRQKLLFAYANAAICIDGLIYGCDLISKIKDGRVRSFPMPRQGVKEALAAMSSDSKITDLDPALITTCHITKIEQNRWAIRYDDPAEGDDIECTGVQLPFTLRNPFWRYAGFEAFQRLRRGENILYHTLPPRAEAPDIRDLI